MQYVVAFQKAVIESWLLNSFAQFTVVMKMIMLFDYYIAVYS